MDSARHQQSVPLISATEHCAAVESKAKSMGGVKGEGEAFMPQV
jgi:hypothetical protein